MKGFYPILGIIGLLLALYGVLSAILYSNYTWFSYFSLGGTLLLAVINEYLKNESLFGNTKSYLLKTYGIYLAFGILIELVGRFALHLWRYPSFDFADELIHVYLLGYPFAFFFIHESFKLIRRYVPSLASAMILTTLINAFIHEIPNTFAWEWVYTIPYVRFEILRINIVVIIGWVILVSVPLTTERILRHPFLKNSAHYPQ